MGVEWSELQLTDGPWLEIDKIGWRVHNSGNKAVASHNVFIRISDSSGPIFEKDESKSDPVAADQYKDFEFSKDDFNKKLAAAHQMRGGQAEMPSEWETYRFELFVDTSNGYDKGGSIEFGVDLEEAKATAKQHQKRARLEKPEQPSDQDSLDVSFLQEALRDLGYYQGGIDGTYGDSTEKAVEDFKADNYLSANGKVIGDRTWEVLHQKLDEQSGEGTDGKLRKVKNFRYA